MVCIGQGLSEILELPLCSQDTVVAHHVCAMVLESLLSPQPSSVWPLGLVFKPSGDLTNNMYNNTGLF